jgi:SAM-dependent MidA family methyltransferase
MCHFRHRAHTDPYINLGLQDITAHVDFSALAEQGAAAGFALAGYTTQAHFLIGCGFDELLTRAGSAGSEAYMDAVLAAKQLVLPSEMGERFKVLGLQRGFDAPLRGFGVRDLCERL